MKNANNDLIKIDSINAKGYGTIPKIIMQDKRLQTTAKSIYAYLCSFCGKGNQAYPSRNAMLNDLGIGKDTFYKHMRLLKEYGYVSQHQKKNGGKFTHNVYTLETNPVGSTPASLCNESSDTAMSDKTASSCHNFSDTVKQDINNNSIKNNNNKINHSIYNNLEREEDKRDYNYYFIQIKNNIGFDELSQSFEKHKDLLNSIVMLMADVFCGGALFYKIGGVETDADIVKQRMFELKSKHIRWLLMTLGDHAEPKYNTRNYLLTIIFNAPITTNTEKYIKAKQLFAAHEK